MKGWMIFRGDVKDYPCIVYRTKDKCDEVIEHLVKTDPKTYSGLVARKV